MRILLLILGLISAVTAGAKCMSEQLTISPNQDEVNENACLLFESYGTAQPFIETLSFDTQVFLTADNGEEIQLNTIAYNPGQFNVNQAILQPEHSLTPGLTYTLNFGKLDHLDRLPHSLGPDQAPRTWTAKADTQRPPIKLFTPPKFIKSEAQFFGCGPAVNAKFEFITNSDTPVLVKTELMDLTDGKTYSYFLKTSTKDTLSIGHGMCAGAFRFKPKHEYQVRFSIMDSCNTLADDWTDWIGFENPFRSLE